MTPDSHPCVRRRERVKGFSGGEAGKMPTIANAIQAQEYSISLQSKFLAGVNQGCQAGSNAVMLSRAKHLILFVYGSDKQILRCPLPLRGGEAPAQNDRAAAAYTFTRNGVARWIQSVHRGPSTPRRRRMKIPAASSSPDKQPDRRRHIRYHVNGSLELGVGKKVWGGPLG